MEEVRSILDHLDRIETMRRANAGSGELLEELRALLRAADGWLEIEGGDAAKVAVRKLRESLSRDMIEV
jgi:hypothetical protein